MSVTERTSREQLIETKSPFFGDEGGVSLEDSEAGWLPFDERLSSFLRNLAACLCARSLAKFGDELGEGGEGPVHNNKDARLNKRAATLSRFIIQTRAPHFALRFRPRAPFRDVGIGNKRERDKNETANRRRDRISKTWQHPPRFAKHPPDGSLRK